MTQEELIAAGLLRTDGFPVIRGGAPTAEETAAAEKAAADKEAADAAAAEEDEDDEDTIESLKAELEESRKDQAKLRRQVAANKGATTRAKKTPAKTAADEDDGEAAQKLEAAEKRAAELESRFQKTQAETIADKLGFLDAEDAVKLLDWDEIGDPDDKAEVRDALKRLKKDKPHLVGEKVALGGGKGRGGEGVKRTMNDVIRDAAARRG
jgi:hypothetical protein